MKTNLIEIDIENETRVVEFDGRIDAVRLGGTNLSDIHELAVKVDSLYLGLSNQIKVLSYLSLGLAITVLFIGAVYTLNVMRNSNGNVEIIKVMTENMNMREKLRVGGNPG